MLLWLCCLKSVGSSGDTCIIDPCTIDTPVSVGTIRTSPGAVRLGGGILVSWSPGILVGSPRFSFLRYWLESSIQK